MHILSFLLLSRSVVMLMREILFLIPGIYSDGQVIPKILLFEQAGFSQMISLVNPELLRASFVSEPLAIISTFSVVPFLLVPLFFFISLHHD